MKSKIELTLKQTDSTEPVIPMSITNTGTEFDDLPVEEIIEMLKIVVCEANLGKNEITKITFETNKGNMDLLEILKVAYRKKILQIKNPLNCSPEVYLTYYFDRNGFNAAYIADRLGFPNERTIKNFLDNKVTELDLLDLSQFNAVFDRDFWFINQRIANEMADEMKLVPKIPGVSYLRKYIL
jgi:hypothetical protein